MSYEVEDSCSVPCVWDDPDEIVHQLLTGRNHHNENPLLIWQRGEDRYLAAWKSIFQINQNEFDLVYKCLNVELQEKV